MPQKRNLERVLLSGKWEIDMGYGIQYLAAYLEGENHIKETQETELKATFIQSNGTVSLASDYSAETAEGSVAHIRMSGAMRMEDGFCSNGVRSTIAELRAADRNPNVSAIAFEVNSGGGESVAGTELSNAIKDIRNGGRTRVGVYFQTLASAALRGVLHADFIMAASEGSDVGSVGTYISLNKGAVRWMKENQEDIYARQSTMKNGAFRAYIAGDSGPLEDIVTQNAQFFIDAVESARPGMSRTSKEAERLRSGDIFAAAEAVTFGLIDGIATFGELVSMLQAKPESLSPNIGSKKVATNSQPMSKKFIQRINEMFGTRLAEDSKIEDAVNAVESAEFEEEEEEFEEEEQDQEEEEQEEQEEEGTVEERLAQIESTLSTVASTMQALSETNAELKASLATSNKNLATIKARKGPKKTVNQQPNVSQFNTVKKLKSKTGIGSKYSTEQ